MKKVLVIAYNFPPCGGGGVQRTTKFCKYLPQKGWEPVVITVTENVHPIKDESLLKDICAIEDITRVPFSDINALRARFKGKIINDCISLFNVLCSIPDTKRKWNRSAWEEIEKKLRTEEIDIVYISCAPFSNALLAKNIKKKYPSVPVVIDFRDEWANDPSIHYLPFYRGWNRRLERSTFDVIDGFITVTEKLRDNFVINNSFKKGSRVILNGFDSEDIETFEEIEESESNDCLNLTYIGTLSWPRVPDNLFNAIDELIGEGKLTVSDIRVNLVGAHEKYANRAEYINVVGYVAHDKITEHMALADMLLIIVPQLHSEYLTGKIFECVASFKPILGLMPEGIAKDFITATNSGITAPLEDVDKIKNTLLELVELKKKGSLSFEVKLEELAKYQRDTQTDELISFFEEIIEHSNNL